MFTEHGTYKRYKKLKTHNKPYNEKYQSQNTMN